MDYPENQREFNRRIERELQRLDRAIEQELAKRMAIIGRQQNPRLMRTIEEFDDNEESTYPAQGSGVNVFPAVFLSGGFTDLPGTQTGQYRAHRETAQVNVLCLSGAWLPPGTVIEAWQDRGTDFEHKGEWWTTTRPCLPERLPVQIRLSDNQFVVDYWYSYAPCGDYVPTVLGETTECTVPYSPYAPASTLHYFDDGFDLETATEWSIPSPWEVGDPLGGAYDDDTALSVLWGEGLSPAVLTVTIGESGGFVQLRYSGGDDAGLSFSINGTEVWHQTSDDGEWIVIGPFELDAGVNELSFAIYGTSSGILKLDDITIWGAE